MMYYRLSEGLSKYKLIPENESVYEHINDFDKDHYISIFKYNQEQYKNWLATKTVAGIKDVVTNKLFFDFDSKDNVALAQKDATALCERLMQAGIEPGKLQIAFSGQKGFSVEVPLQESLSVDEFKNITKSLAQDLGTYDTVVNDPQRITRITGTRHNTSGLYKFPLSLNSLTELSVEEIKNLAANRDNIDDDVAANYGAIALPKTIKELKSKTELVKPVVKIDHDLDLSTKPRWLTPAKYAIQEGFFVEGERSEALMILGATYKNQGLNEDVVYRMLKGVAERQARRNDTDRFPDKEIYNNIIKTIFNPTWRGGQYAQDHAFLVKVAARMGLNVRDESDDHLVTVDSVSSIFKAFATNIDKNTMKLGIEEVDKEIRVTTSMLVGLLAAPSAGKTSISLNTLNDASNRDIDSVFFSLDMGAPLVYQRLIQKHTGKNSKSIFEEYKNSTSEIAKIEQTLKEQYKNVGFCFKSGVSVEDMRDYIQKRQDKTGKKTKLAVVDYLECIQGPYSDSTANTAMIAQKLKDLANELEITLLLLLQPQKHAGDPSSELLSYRNIKGSSAIEQAASVIFTMWRPGFSPKNPQDDKYATIAAVKNRMGGLNTFDFRWDGLTGTLGTLDFEGRQDLKRVRADQEAERLAKKDDF